MNINPFNRNNPQDDEIDIMEDMQENNDQQIMHDQMQKQFNYPSNSLPEDFYQYRKFSNVPEAQAEFEGLIDKDVTFANLSKSEREYLRFVAETIKICEDIFVKEQDIKVRDEKGREILIKDQLTFDEDFRPIINYLKSGYKYDHVSSRASGDDRAAKLDITSNTNINKILTKKKGDNQNRWGMGQ